MTRRPRAIARPAPAARRWLTLAAILAFFLQSLAVQTHIHATDSVAPVVKAVSAQAPAPVPLKSQDQVDQCRLCQELVHAGNFITPSVLTVPASQLLALTTIFALLPPATAPPAAFAWQSRAPPRH
jgi:hypothetical protein